MNYENKTTNDNYPKTLVIRNTKEGLIWQIYHVQKLSEAEWLAKNAHNNSFYGITLEDYQPNEEETFTNWREESKQTLKELL